MEYIKTNRFITVYSDDIWVMDFDFLEGKIEFNTKDFPNMNFISILDDMMKKNFYGGHCY